jgi:hypothetical protein
MQPRVAQLGLGLDAGQPGDLDAPDGCGLGDSVEQCRFSHPGLTSEHRHAAQARSRGVEQTLKCLKFALPAHQGHARTLLQLPATSINVLSCLQASYPGRETMGGGASDPCPWRLQPRGNRVFRPNSDSSWSIANGSAVWAG